MAEEQKTKEDTKQEEAKAKEQKKEEKAQKSKETKQAEPAAESKHWSSKIKELGDKIVSLTLMQAKELGDYLKEEHGIEPAGGAPVMVAGAPGGEQQAEAEEEKTSFDVVLKEFGEKKIQVIKEVRALTGLGLKEAKELVDNAPKPVKEGLSKDEAQKAKEKLEAVGAVVEMA